MDDNDGGYRLYFSGRAEDGSKWPGIGIALSDDGIHWTKTSHPILTIDDFAGLMQLNIIALADVIRTHDGRWLLFAEGYKNSGEGDPGFVVCAAISKDGLDWSAIPEPVITARDFGLRGQHAANPKCVEISPGHFLLGLNVEGPGYGFDLYLATSEDARNWRPLNQDPVISRGIGDKRIESFYMSRDSLLDGSNRTYYFRASSNDTARSSRIVVADMDHKTPGDVHGVHPSLGTTGSFHIESGSAFYRCLSLLGEAQLSIVLDCSSDINGALSLTCDSKHLLTINGKGTCHFLDKTILRGDKWTGRISIVLRFIRPDRNETQIRLSLWHENVLIAKEISLFSAGNEPLLLDIRVDEGSIPWQLRHLDFWVPTIEAEETPGDAHMYLGNCCTGDPLLPNVSNSAFSAILDERHIGRALVMPYGHQVDLDAFGQIIYLAGFPGSRIYPLIRLGEKGVMSPRLSSDFLLNQCELLWQRGQLFGFKVHLGFETFP